MEILNVRFESYISDDILLILFLGIVFRFLCGREATVISMWRPTLTSTLTSEGVDRLNSSTTLTAFEDSRRLMLGHTCRCLTQLLAQHMKIWVWWWYIDTVLHKYKILSTSASSIKAITLITFAHTLVPKSELPEAGWPSHYLHNQQWRDLGYDWQIGWIMVRRIRCHWRTLYAS